MNEFELIQRYFTRPARSAVLGVGDDCALIAPPPDHELALTTDTMVEGRHFLAGTDPEALGHKLLAVNLSDLAAMGAVPRWALLAVSLPEADPLWLALFARGLFALADFHGVELVGGDTTRGPRTLTMTALGILPRGSAVRRAGARPGDAIWVSGALGDAALAVAARLGQLVLPVPALAECTARLDRPEPRVELGVALRGLASAMIDVSDGLAGDLGHLCRASGVGASVAVDRIPASPAMRALLAAEQRPEALAALLGGGDDYELCFTAPPEAARRIRALGVELDLEVAAIGEIVGTPGLQFVDGEGRVLGAPVAGFDHFRDDAGRE